MAGIYYLIFKTLAWENINVIEVVSTMSELTIVLDDQEVVRAFNLLQNNLIKKRGAI
jgi:aspartokinase